MKGVRVLTVLAVSFATFSLALADNVYKSFDENGNVVYSDRPIDSESFESFELDIQHTRSNRVARESQGVNEYLSSSRERDAEAAREQREADAYAKGKAEHNAANCRAAKEAQERVNSRSRLYKPLPDGGREYLSSAQVDKARKDAAASVAEWCKE